MYRGSSVPVEHLNADQRLSLLPILSRDPPANNLVFKILHHDVLLLMGYHEIDHQLCEVSFAIARFHRADEPEKAAWNFLGYGFNCVEDEFGDACDSGSTILDADGDRAGEHIVGPECDSPSGYSGYRISMAEIKGWRRIAEAWFLDASVRGFLLSVLLM